MPNVDLAAYTGREQAYIKHCLLENYLPDWGYKIGSAWDDLVFIDGFAGPWRVADADLSDSSFSVAINALKKMQSGLEHARGRKIRVRSILVERRKSALHKLQSFAQRHTTPGFDVHAIGGCFTERLNEITHLISRSRGKTFRFVFLDPKGWKDIPMPVLARFLNARSCEVLINLMARHAVRFLEQNDRKDSYDALFGRVEAMQVLRNTAKHRKLSVMLQEYCLSLKLLCGFKYVSAAAILEPNEEAIRYFLVFGTNHPRGIEVFKKAEQVATRIQNKVRFATIFGRKCQGEFDMSAAPALKTKIVYELRNQYIAMAMERVIEDLLKGEKSLGVPYCDLFARAMELPLVSPEDLIEGIKDLPSVKMVLQGERRRSPSVENAENDRVVVIDRKALEQQLAILKSRSVANETASPGDLGLAVN
ncbi:MAG TPA: three-Cys-motif partner protein TcmP [Verrucomicrobiae bacterium]|nr:three-Cys-motif partner protein TcmP [Verrucomicrobiae bacterium]